MKGLLYKEDKMAEMNIQTLKNGSGGRVLRSFPQLIDGPVHLNGYNAAQSATNALKQTTRMSIGWAVMMIVLGFLVVALPLATVMKVPTNPTPAMLNPETDHMGSGEARHAHSPAPMTGSAEEIAYSEFMHKLYGIFVLLLGYLVLLEQRLSKPGWLRWGWPSLFLLSGIYLGINSDQDAWPIGDKGFIESLQDPITFQHKLAALILMLLGVSEFLLRIRWRPGLVAGVFPTLAILAGIILLFHSHAGHHSFKIARQHQFMAGTALTIGVTNFLSKRFDVTKPIWPFLILLLGLELFFYSE
jgi:hypothetical protein